MAEAVVGSLVYQFKADIADLKNGFATVQSDLAKVKSGLGTVNDNFRRVGKDAANHVGLARHEMVNLSRQIQDVGVSLAGGQSPFMVLIQQGSQIADIFGSSKAGASAAIKGFGAQVASVVMSARFGLAGVAVAAAAIGTAAYQSEKSLEKLSDTAKALGSNRGAVKEFNRQLDVLGVDPEKANEEMTALAQKIREAQIAGGDLADKLAKVGININQFDLSKPGQFVQLFQQIAEKVRNGSTELDKLNAIKFLGLSNEFMRVFNDGKNALDGLAKSSQGAAEKTTKPVEEAWRRLRQYWSDTVKYIVDTAVAIADKIAVAVVAAIDKIAALINYAKQKWSELKSSLGMGSPFPESYSGKSGGKGQELPPIDVAGGGGVDLSGFSAPKAKAASKGSSARDAIKEYITNMREAADLARTEAENFVKGNVEKEKSLALTKAEAIAKQEGRILTAQQREEILKLAGSTEQYKMKIDQLKEAQDNLNNAMQEFGDVVSSSLENLIIRGDKAQNVLKELVKTLASSALQGVLTGNGMFGSAMGLSGQNGAMGGILGMLGRGAKSLFSGFFADGGSIPAGKWGIAGEAGPELVQGPANVTPMGGGAAQVTIHNYANAQVDARQMSDGQIIVTVQKMIKDGLRQVPNIMAEAQRRSF